MEFVDIQSKNKVVVMLGVVRIAELVKQIDNRWSFNWFNNHEILASDELRRIADKLDELNHESNY